MITWEGRNWHPRGFEGIGYGAAFYGEEGSMIVGANDYKLFDRRDKPIEEGSGRGSDAVHIANFLDAIRTATPPSAEIEIGYKSTLLCLLGSIAHRTGNTLNCDPATGRPIEDEAAMALWSRDGSPTCSRGG